MTKIVTPMIMFVAIYEILEETFVKCLQLFTKIKYI